jgi:hypothetical protein
MLARKLPYFNTKTLTLNLANLELWRRIQRLSFHSFPKFLLFLFFDFMICNGGRRAENKIWDNYQFILLMRVSHFRSVSKTIYIPEDLGCQCDWRTCRSWCGILDASSRFHWEILSCTSLLVKCHGILLGSFVSWLRVTPHMLWYYLHASYLPRAWVSVDLNLAAPCEVLWVVDELLMNPINFHIDHSSRLINGCSNWLQERLPHDDGGLLMRIHIHDHEVNQGQRILELDQYILCYLIGLHHSGIYQL